MSKLNFFERLKSDKPLLADGAMGTMLHARGIPIDACFDGLNLSKPDHVRSVHRAYVNAGADLIETNTFGANRYKLADHGLEEQVEEINRTGVRLVREAIAESGREDVYVAGSVGPLGIGLAPYGRLKPEDARTAYVEQIKALVAEGVDTLIFETFNDLAELKLALETAHEIAPKTPVICQMTFGPDDRTLLGYLPGRVAH